MDTGQSGSNAPAPGQIGGAQHHGQQQVKYNVDNGGHYGASAAVC